MQLLNASAIMDDLSILFRPLYSKIILALVILFAGIFIGRFLGKFVKKILGEFELNAFFKSTTGTDIKADSIAGSVVSYFIYFAFALWALEVIGLTSVTLNIIAGAVLLLVVIATALAVKDFIPNAIAGIFIYVRKTIKEGDVVEIDNAEGRVVHVGLIETKLTSKSNDLLIIPNSAFLKSGKIKIKKGNQL